MERNAQKNGLINLLTLAAIGMAGFAVARYSNTLSGMVSVVFMGLGALISAVSWFQMRLIERERLEKLEFDELSKSAAASALFTTGESEIFPAQRSREQFERFFVPGFTVLLFLLQAGTGLLLLRVFQNAIPGPIMEPLVCLGLFGMFFLLLFLVGRFATSLARLEGLRLLRPGATCLLLSAYLCLLVLAGVGITWLGFLRADLYLARGLAALLVLTGLETLVNLVLDLYRPRLKGKVERPMYESRLVSLLGQPEGLITTAAQTLDYQFGFKVSETWAYRLFARWLPWLIIGQLGVLVLSTTVIFVDPGEQAVLERFGEFVAVLKPGGHFKLPWPVDRTYRFPTEQVQTIDVGFSPDSDPMAGNTVLWTVPHTKEENFLVANRVSNSVSVPTRPIADNGDNAGNTPPVPVSLLTVSIPVQFRITNLVDWVYENQEPTALLEQLSYREVVRYFVSADLNDIMSTQREEAAQTIHDRIQAEADRHKLGASIIFVGLQDIHPPVKVAPDYEKYVSVSHTTNADIRNALAESITRHAAADIETNRIITEANSEAQRMRTNGMALTELFTNQIPAYNASPAVYVQRGYLEAIAEAVANSRTYILMATNAHYVPILDFQDKIRPDILGGVSLPSPPSGPK
jgi:regulator of protease activity HflC (stomatin/prohibitin superfamily)